MTEVTDPSAEPSAPPLESGREACARHDWATAMDLLQKADAESPLSPDDLGLLGLAAFFAGRPDVTITALEQAFRVHRAAGAAGPAALTAAQLARQFLHSGRPSVASGWLRRAERLLPPGDGSAAHGMVALVQSEIALTTGTFDRALELARRAAEIGDDVDDADLRAHTMAHLGTLYVGMGQTDEGLALIEEASVAAVSGELSPVTAGMTCCTMISACRELTDYQRAIEWIEQTERYCSEQSVSGFPGICRIHQAEIGVVQGNWDDAEKSLLRAAVELEPYRPPPLADAYYAIGDIRRLRGEFEQADEALREADTRGRSPQPARAMIRLTQGDTKGARIQLERALADEPWDRWARSRMLPALAVASIADGDAAAARRAADELGGILGNDPPPALDASLRLTMARVLLAEGDAEGAAREARAAARRWREVEAPYEVMKARVVLADALRALGDDIDADGELQLAIEEFGRLGARPDAASAALELRLAVEARAGRAQVHRTFMFTDIEGSTVLAEKLGDAEWGDRLRQHDLLVHGHITVAGGEVVKTTGDGFFAAFLDAAEAVACAEAVQSALATQAGGDPDSIRVRIGLHTADARHEDGDYSGLGVHVAARVGALARGGEILVTEAVLAEAGAASGVGSGVELRDVRVRGVSQPVRVATLRSADAPARP